MRKLELLRLLVLVCLFGGILAEQCDVVPKCTCKIGDEQVEVSEQYTGSEALTGAVGALGSMVVTGGGVSVWYLIKRKKPNSVSSDSDRSDSDVTTGGNRTSRFDTQQRPPNIYNAGKNDNNFPHVGVRNNNMNI